METKASPAEQLTKQLTLFVFFHLGSDAEVSIQSNPQVLKVSIEHPRVEGFRFELPSQDLETMIRDPEGFEDYLLELLVRYRRSS
jgi:hypothetical protein